MLASMLARLQEAQANCGFSGILHNLLRDGSPRVSADRCIAVRNLCLSGVSRLRRAGIPPGVRRLSKSGHVCRVTDMLSTGYVIRNLVLFAVMKGRCWLVSAVVGADALSILSLEAAGQPRTRITFPCGSAPTGLSTCPNSQGKSTLVAVNFNFDTSHESYYASCLWSLKDVEAVAFESNGGSTLAADRLMLCLYCLDGHWEFRAVAMQGGDSDGWRTAMIGRDGWELRVCESFDAIALIKSGSLRRVTLCEADGISLESVGVSALPGNPSRYRVSLQNCVELTVCETDSDGSLAMSQMLPLTGSNRSSDAVRGILGAGWQDLATALWVGYSNEVEQAHPGQLAVCPELGDRQYGERSICPPVATLPTWHVVISTAMLGINWRCLLTMLACRKKTWMKRVA